MIKIKEEFIQGKNNNCEDKIFKGKRFIAVIDGCTSKNKIAYNGKSGGEKASELIYNVLSRHDKTKENFNVLLKSIKLEFEKTYRANHIDHRVSENRMGAVFIVYDNLYSKIYLIGDCQAILKNSDGDKEYIGGDKKVDEVTSNARAMFNQKLILSGEETVESLLKNDKGRDFITPLLVGQLEFENVNHELGYPVINGLDIPKKFIQEFKVEDNIEKIILASDGYPKLFDSLKKSEYYLKTLLREDPLMINIYKSTKGLQEGNTSFDDRAFISFEV